MGFWEVQLAGEWKSLGRVVGQACNEAQARGATQLKFESHGQRYIIDFPTMTQRNVTSGKSRAVKCRSPRHTRPAPVHVHTPSAPPAPAAPAKAPAKKGFGGRALLAAGLGGAAAGAAALGAGLVMVDGVCDLGDIGDITDDIMDAAGDLAADIGDAAGDAADAVADMAAGAHEAAMELS